MVRRSLALASAVAVTAVLSACAASGAPGGGTSSLSYGYMIPGEQVATALGMKSTDTLPELAATRAIPTGLDEAIKYEIQQGNWNARCTRRFGGPTAYAVIFHRVCDASAGPESEPQVVIAFASDGRKRGTVRWTGANTVSALVPSRRF